MKTKLLITFFLLAVFLAFFFFSYSKVSAPNFRMTTQLENQNTQIANPASVYCIEHGGELEIKEGKAGQYGVCNFPDGKFCEEWAYFRGECKI
jgi:putative hemolysin